MKPAQPNLRIAAPPNPLQPEKLHWFPLGTVEFKPSSSDSFVSNKLHETALKIKCLGSSINDLVALTCKKSQPCEQRFVDGLLNVGIVPDSIMGIYDLARASGQRRLLDLVQCDQTLNKGWQEYRQGR